MDVIYIGEDDWSRKLYKSTKTNIVYVDIDGVLHDRTPDWEEPCSPIIAIDLVNILKGV